MIDSKLIRKQLMDILEKAGYLSQYPGTMASILVDNGVVIPVHSNWETEMDDLGWLKHTCPICGYVKRTDIHVSLGWNYCPNCGAMMDLE